MPFLLAEILNFQGSTHRIGVGSFSKNTFCLPRQDSGMKVLEGNNSDKLRQIGAMGLVRYYSFTTI